MTGLVEQFLVEALSRGWGNGAGYAIPCRLQAERARVDLRAPGVDPDAAAKYISTHPEHVAFEATHPGGPGPGGMLHDTTTPPRIGGLGGPP